MPEPDMDDRLPVLMENELRQLGVMPQPKPTPPPRSYEFRKSVFDEHGEPDF